MLRPYEPLMSIVPEGWGVIGALGGAAVGAATGGSVLGGAAVGGAAGAATGALTSPRQIDLDRRR